MALPCNYKERNVRIAVGDASTSLCVVQSSFMLLTLCVDNDMCVAYNPLSDIALAACWVKVGHTLIKKRELMHWPLVLTVKGREPEWVKPQLSVENCPQKCIIRWVYPIEIFWIY